MPHKKVEPRRILIVDTDRHFSTLLAVSLRGAGYLVAETATDSVLATLKQFDAAMVLCDVDGTGSNGDLLGPIAAEKPDIIVLPMAPRPDRRRRDRSNEATAPFINKSCGVDEAVAIITQEFAQRESLAAAACGTTPTREAGRAELDFLARVSHELRTPLNAIIGFSELMLHGSHAQLDQSAHKAYVEDIHASGRHLLEVINDILDFARAESGKLLLQESTVDIVDVMASVNRLLGPRMRDAGLNFSQSIPPHLSRIWCDELKLKRMLLNLITNAVKFTPPGGQIEVDVKEDAGGIVISVRDTGIGISKENLTRVLEPFVQVDSAFSRHREGTGLGLPLVKAMVEIHGGSIVLASELQKGTTAQLFFPHNRLVSPPDVECMDGWTDEGAA